MKPDPEAVARMEAATANAERSERVDKCWKQCNVPDRYRTARLTDLASIPEDVFDAYREAVKKLRGALDPDASAIFSLCGEIGSGKTHMACGLVNEFCAAGRSARYLKAADYVEGLRATWKTQRADDETAYVQKHVQFSLLVLDEWQVRNDTANENIILLRLLDKRYEARRVTVLIGNHGSTEEFEQSIDARVADRMCDGGGIILCNWPSIRGRIGN